MTREIRTDERGELTVAVVTAVVVVVAVENW